MHFCSVKGALSIYTSVFPLLARNSGKPLCHFSCKTDLSNLETSLSSGRVIAFTHLWHIIQNQTSLTGCPTDVVICVQCWSAQTWGSWGEWELLPGGKRKVVAWQHWRDCRFKKLIQGSEGTREFQEAFYLAEALLLSVSHCQVERSSTAFSIFASWQISAAFCRRYTNYKEETRCNICLTSWHIY